jgi:hypothetical protein
VLGVKFLVEWRSPDGSHYRVGDQVSLPRAEAFELRTRGVVEPLDSSDPLWDTWEETGS